MDQATMFRHVFEAFSSLSDAQELLAADEQVSANERIDHAKLHLDAVLQSDLDTFRQAMFSGHLTCSLAEGGEPCARS